MTTPFGHHSAEHNPLTKWLNWAKSHQEMIFIAGIVAILLAAGIPYYLYSQRKADQDAQNMLNLGQYYQHAQVDPKNGPFKTELEKDQQALQTFQRITTDFAGTPTSKIARYYLAKNQYVLGQYQQAYSSFDAASQELKGTPLSDEAFLGKVLCLEDQNQLPQATTLLESFLKDHSDSFIAPELQLNLSDLYMKAKNKQKAVDELKLVIKNNSDSDWGKEASRRLESLNS
jgi:TolA-binding protein